MRQNGRHQGFDIIGQDVVSSIESSARLGGTEQSQRTARAGAQVHIGVAAGTVSQFYDVTFDRRSSIHRSDGFGSLENFFGRKDRRNAFNRMPQLLSLQHDHFVRQVGITQPNAQQEAVELGFGEGKRPLVFNWVLGCQHHEGAGQRIGDAIYRHLTLVHRFEQGSLGFGRCAVDFIRKDDLPENRSETELELARFLIEDRDAGHVGGQHIGRELHPIEEAAQRFGHGTRHNGLADTGDIFDEDVSLAKQANYDCF